MNGVGAFSRYSAAHPRPCVLQNRISNFRIAASQTRLHRQSRQMVMPRGTAAVDAPGAPEATSGAPGLKSSASLAPSTGNYYESIYQQAKTGDSLDSNYSNDTAASPKNRRAGGC